MSSRKFFYFLPRPGHKLAVKRTIHELERAGMRFDETAFVYSIADDGVIASIPKEIALVNPVANNLPRLLTRRNMQVESQCRDRKTYLTCSFGSAHITPIFSVNIPTKLWFRVQKEMDGKYERVLVKVAQASNASFVVEVDDVPDDFDKNIVLSDQFWNVNLMLSDGTRLRPCTAYVNPEYEEQLVIQGLHPTSEQVEGYAKYRC